MALLSKQPQYNQEETTMHPDIIAELVATSFNADRPVLHRYSATITLRAPDKAATPRSTGYGETADSARSSAIRAALKYWGCVTVAAQDVHVSSRTLPDGYGAPYLDEADACMALANRMPAGSQAYKDMVAVAEWYEQQYIAVRYEYLRTH